MAQRPERYRDPISGRYAGRPGSQPIKRMPYVEMAFNRHVAAIEARLRYQYRKQHGHLSFSLRLALAAAARISARLEVLEERAARGLDIDDGTISKLTTEQRIQFKRLGLAETVLAPPPSPKPNKPLAAALRDGAAP